MTKKKQHIAQHNTEINNTQHKITHENKTLHIKKQHISQKKQQHITHNKQHIAQDKIQIQQMSHIKLNYITPKNNT